MSPGDPGSDPRYPEIADHGVIGDLQTAALVSSDGTIDFLCLPEFDSPTVFARLLDAERGGYFAVAPLGDVVRREQRYVRDTNVLVTRFVCDAAEVELVDFMPLRRAAGSQIVRLARTVRGTATVRGVCAPRFDYARGSHEVSLMRGAACFAAANGPRLRLTTRATLLCSGNDVVAECTLAVGETVAFVLELLPASDLARREIDRWATRAFRRTIVFWRRWIGKSTYTGEWRSAVHRSALVLKLLQSRRSGAIIAAPTFGLPERVGGARNWDFRYSWIRDASFTVFALGRIGLSRGETRSLARWVVARCLEAQSPGALQSLYGIDGRRELTEQVLDHLEGYRASRPVRIGNAAYDQLQLDIYGELMDALYQHDEHAEPTSRRLWEPIVELTDFVCRNWERPDQGIWEVRGGRQHFLYSRVMCWVAIDRALRIAARRRLSAPRDSWRQVREAVRADVDEHFWNESLGTYVGTRDGNAVDAACLVMPLVGFISPLDARWQSTLRVVESRLVRDGLVRRYDMVDMDTHAGADAAPTFTICSFWYVECLALAGELSKAREVMARVLRHANSLGLFAENIGVDGEHTGNFPQGLVHAGVIGAAVSLSGGMR